MKKKSMVSVWLHLNARLQPIHREEIFEELFAEILSDYKWGEPVGGGTLQMPTGEIKSCAIELMIRKERLEEFCAMVAEMDMIPRGSKLIIGEEETAVGSAEGLALYLNGTDLPAEIYEHCDINYLIEQLDGALEDAKQGFSYWEGDCETALYFYGRSYAEMKEKMAPIVERYPLCARSRIEQIA